MKTKKHGRLPVVSSLVLGTLVACSSSPPETQVVEDVSLTSSSATDFDKEYTPFGVTISLPEEVEQNGTTTDTVPVVLIENDPKIMEKQEEVLQAQGLTQKGSYVASYQDETYTYLINMALYPQEAHLTYWVFLQDDTKNYTENFVESAYIMRPYHVEEGQITVSDATFFRGDITAQGISFVSGTFMEEFHKEMFHYQPQEGDLFQYRGEFEGIFDVKESAF